MNEIRTALGFIETVGLAAAVAAADAALKAANVSLIGREISKGYGYVTVKIAGDVGAVKAALAAARAVCENVNRVWSVDVIPRPAASLGPVLAWNKDTTGAKEWLADREPVRLAEKSADEGEPVRPFVPMPAPAREEGARKESPDPGGASDEERSGKTVGASEEEGEVEESAAKPEMPQETKAHDAESARTARRRPKRGR